MLNLLRRDLAAAAACTLLALILLLGPGADEGSAGDCIGSGTPAYRLGADEAGKAILCLINRERAAAGLRSLRVDRRSAKAAGGHNEMMLRKRCFAHQCSGERDLAGRMEDSGYLPCSCSWLIGETIAWGSGTAASPENIVRAWMDSSLHRATILNGRFEAIGVAVDTGSPTGGKQSATFTADFAFKD